MNGAINSVRLNVPVTKYDKAVAWLNMESQSPKQDWNLRPVHNTGKIRAWFCKSSCSSRGRAFSCSFTHFLAPRLSEIMNAKNQVFSLWGGAGRRKKRTPDTSIVKKGFICWQSRIWRFDHLLDVTLTWKFSSHSLSW